MRALAASLLSSAICAASVTGAFAQDDRDDHRVFFASGSSHVAPDQTAVLDQAARLFREGNPFVMVLSGTADTVGVPERNLDLSLRRARAVADGLVARGIPAGRLQVLGRGNSELEVETADGVASADNRVVVISWR